MKTMIDDNDEIMEMPTPCVHCGEIFDLNDGYASEKWHKSTIICEECKMKELKEIEQDEFWEDANIELSDGLFTFKEPEAYRHLTKENAGLIQEIAKKVGSNEKEVRYLQ